VTTSRSWSGTGASLVVASLLAARTAGAKVAVDHDVRAEYDACVTDLRAKGFGAVVDELDASSNDVNVERTNKVPIRSETAPASKTAARDGTGTGSTVTWNPTDRSPYPCDHVAMIRALRTV
jgi:hypothetical protein